MANATAITIRDLVANNSFADPTADILDTGTAAVTLKAQVAGKSDRVVFRVQNTSTVALAVQANAGNDPPAFRSGLGAVAAVAALAQNAVAWLGPFESSRFEQADGSISLTFTPSSLTIACNVQAFRLPKV